MKKQPINPINAFPTYIQELINHYSEIKGYPIEYFSTAFLTAVSAAVGRSITLSTGNYTAVGIIWSAIVGKRGFTKSEPQKDAFEPLVDLQHNYYRDFIRDREEIEQYKIDNPKDKNPPRLPPKKELILNDFTPEVLSIALSNNPRGCTVVYDELDGFFARFNRYNPSGDEQMFLSLFNGDGILRSRVNSNTDAAVRQSFLSIIGTIQPGILKQALQGKQESGFADRWLLCFPQDVIKQYPSAIYFDKKYVDGHRTILNNLILLEQQPLNTFKFRYTHSSYQIVNDYQRQMIDTENRTESDTERGILAKMEIYLHRFALLISAMEYGVTGKWSDEVSDEAAKGATILCDYYISEAHQMRTISPLEALDNQWKEVFYKLPDHGVNFKRKEFIEWAAEFNLKSRIADEFLKSHATRTDESLLYKVGQGVYTKNLI